jgi:hypothetical protein
MGIYAMQQNNRSATKKVLTTVSAHANINSSQQRVSTLSM